MNSLTRFGLTQLFRGARRGRALSAGFGALLTVVGLARRNRERGRELLYARTLKDGEGLKIRLERGQIDSEDE